MRNIDLYLSHPYYTLIVSYPYQQRQPPQLALLLRVAFANKTLPGS